jgi:hypothetical protein
MIRTPNDTHLTIVLGRKGTGKSQASIDMLAQQNFQDMPWVIIDYKGEEILVELQKKLRNKIHVIKVTDKPPRTPGLYYMHPKPMLDDVAMEAWLMQVYKNEHTGLYVDEGYALPDYGRSVAFTLILTQGRSKRIPVIVLYQRPVWMSRFAVAQADFVRVFKQGDIRDRKTITQFCTPAQLPNGASLGPMQIDALPDYYSLWHDVGKGSTSVLIPAPSKERILQDFKSRLIPLQQRSLV